ncbi:MAG: M1 family aminopeptidase [candidate division KSB1 bacterium]|nr:M1 family aminopeptidase [candidate division KSB1 bacterium]MDZ7394021.1 M1 family aminopeptidase [candidate division KSB1 bacterium]
MRRTFGWVSIALWVAVSPWFPRAYAQRPYDVTYYQLNIRIDPSTETIQGVATVGFVSRDSALTAIQLDLSGALTVSAVGGSATGFAHEGDRLTVQLQRAMEPGEEGRVNISYGGRPRNVGGLGMVFARAANAPSVHTISCPYHAYLWMPCNDYPGDKADSVRLVVTVPASMVVASNGRLLRQEVHSDGTTTYTWLESHPIATYLICITAGRYTTITDSYTSIDGTAVPLQYFVYPGDASKAQEDFSVIPRAMMAFERWFGPYPFADEKYGMAECQMIFGGMEHQTMTTIHPAYITGTHANDDVFVHELAHMWWGDCVTVENWHHCWLNEGFASYAEALYTEYYFGREAYHQYMNGDLNALAYKDPVYRYDLTNAMGIFDLVVYRKGAWILHMLRGMVGDSLFKEILGLYRARHAYGNATTEDFRQVCEDVSGRDLGWFFQEWVYEPWHPEYHYGYKVEDRGEGHSARYRVRLFVDQEQEVGPLFHMPLHMEVRHKGGSAYEYHLIPQIEERNLRLCWDTEVRPDTILIDPDGWVLKEVRCTTTPLLRLKGASVVHDSGNNNGRAEAGEVVEMVVRIVNRGVDADDVRVTLLCADPAITVSADTAAIDSLWHREEAEVGPFVFTVSDTATARRVPFVVRAWSADGHVAHDTLHVGVGQAPILLLDDDGGAAYEGYYQRALAELGLYIDYWDAAKDGPPGPQLLGTYRTVLWFTGDDDTTSLTAHEQGLVAEYLDNGGHLILTGQNISSDLFGRGSAADSAFCARYLKCTLVKPGTSDYTMMGVAGDPVAGGMVLSLRGQYGAGNQTAPDVVAPLSPAVMMLKYLPGQGAAAVRWHDPATGAKLIYLAFGFEGIGGPSRSTATQFLQKMLAWFALPAAVEGQERFTGVPVKFRVLPPFPNPCNESTAFLVELPERARLRVMVVNAAGRLVRVLVDEVREAGRYRETWDGRDLLGTPVSSGVYIVRAEANSLRDSTKLLVLR